MPQAGAQGVNLGKEFYFEIFFIKKEKDVINPPI